MAKRFNARSFTAFVVAAAFVVCTVTGIVLYVVPQGRVANWVDWSLLGLAKHDWTNVHTLLGFVFIAVGLVHLWFNWKPLKHHLAERVKGHTSLRVEALAALALAVVFVAGAIAHVPPFEWLLALSDRAKAMWVAAPECEPPYGHAEDSTLDTLARRTFIDPAAAHARLGESGFDLLGPRATVAEIAQRNRTPPMAVVREDRRAGDAAGDARGVDAAIRRGAFYRHRRWAQDGDPDVRGNGYRRVGGVTPPARGRNGSGRERYAEGGRGTPQPAAGA